MEINPPELVFGDAFKKEESNKLIKPKQTKNEKIKLILAVFGVLVTLTGIVFVLRSALFNLPGVKTPELLEFEANPLLPATDFEVSVSTSGKTLDFGQNIVTGYPALFEDRLWLLIKTKSEIQIGIIDSSITYMPIFKLPIGARDIKLYEDSSISFFINGNLDFPSTLYVQKLNSKAEVVVTLQEGAKFISHFYYPTEKIFYYTEYQNKSVYLNGVNLKGEIFKIYNSGFFSDKSMLTGFYLNKNAFGIIESDICYYIEVSTRNAVQKSCELLPANPNNITYWSNSNKGGVYQSVVKGELFLSDINRKERESIGNLNNGELFQSYNMWNNNIYFVKSVLKPVGSLFNAVAQGIYRLNLKNQKTVDQLSDYLPDQNLKFIFTFKSSVYVIANNLEKGDSILKLNHYNILEPASYPISNPLSYPEASSMPISYNVIEKKEWNPMSLGIEGILTIDPIYPDFTI